MPSKKKNKPTGEEAPNIFRLESRRPDETNWDM
jgi:hypothetical protein